MSIFNENTDRSYFRKVFLPWLYFYTQFIHFSIIDDKQLSNIIRINYSSGNFISIILIFRVFSMYFLFYMELFALDRLEHKRTAFIISLTKIQILKCYS